jgi:HKD family nuclease
MNKHISEISAGIQKAYMDARVDANLAYSLQFLTNDHQKGTKVLTYIENELMHCDAFKFIKQCD